MVYIKYSNLNLIKSIDIVKEVGSNHPHGINSPFIYIINMLYHKSVIHVILSENHLMWKKELGP